MDTRYEDNLDRGKSRLFEYAVPEEGITVQVQVTEGKITLYGSHSNPEPSPVWHDYVLSGIHGDKEIFISHETFKGSICMLSPLHHFITCNLRNWRGEQYIFSQGYEWN